MTIRVGFILVGALAVVCGRAATLQPGFAHVPDQMAEQGELLIGELNCVACHAADRVAQERLAPKQAPIVGNKGFKGLPLTPQYLRRLLTDPQSVAPGGTMPDMLHGLDAAEKGRAVDELVHFLISESPESNSEPVAADQFKMKQGRLLYHQVGCVACHAPQEPVAALHDGSRPLSADAEGLESRLQPVQGDKFREAPDDRKGPPAEAGTPNPVPLGDLARKMTVQTLARFLQDPLKVRPSGRMPSLNLTEGEATAIAMYLLRAQAAAPKANGVRAKAQGLSYQYFEGNFQTTADLEKAKAKESGIVPRFDLGGRKKQNFGMRFSGFVSIARDGTYTFYTHSDDGSRLFIGDQLVVDNDGIHGGTEAKGEIDLKAGEHPILLTYFNGGSEVSLKVSYAGPGIGKREIPATALFTHDGTPMLPLDSERFVVDAQKVARGQVRFVSLCLDCHSTAVPVDVQRSYKDLQQIATSGGCLAENPAKGLPKYALSSAQREAIQRTLARRTDLAKPLEPAAQVNHTLAALNCFACHSRGGVGGPTAERAEFFTTVSNVDLGDEGRIPPHLTAVGAKLRPEWLREVLANKGTARPYMATRMPQFGAANVGKLVDALEKTDSSPLTLALSPGAGEGNSLDAKYGRNLVGTGGFACISCHTFASYKSLGIPAMDLTLMTRRLRKDWFHRYVLDPQALRPGTRMPSFFPEGKSTRQDILSGNTERQINAIWAYLSRGKDADLPPGLVQGKMELVATNEPIIYRHFLSGAGSRAIGVGYPEKANLAFDANDLRLAMLWQGSFIDAARHRTGRGEGSVPPLGYNIVRLPPGPEFALLDSPEAKWPEIAGKKGGYRLRGYTLDHERRPTFEYSFSPSPPPEERDRVGPVFEIEDAPIPMPGEVDPFFRRQIAIRAGQASQNLWFRAWLGEKMEEQGGGGFLADGKVKLRIEAGSGTPIVRRSGGRAELLVPVHFSGNEARIVEEIIW